MGTSKDVTVIEDETVVYAKSKVAKKKLAVRRPTMMPPKGFTAEVTKTNFQQMFRWWQKESIKYA